MKKNKKTLLIVIASFALLAALYVGFIFLRNYSQLQQVRAEHAAVSEELQSIQKEHDALTREKEYATTDAFIRQMARELLGWVFPGEYKITDR